MSRGWFFEAYSIWDKPVQQVITEVLDLMVGQYGFTYTRDGAELVRGVYWWDAQSIDSHSDFEVTTQAEAVNLLRQGGGWIDLWHGEGVFGIHFSPDVREVDLWQTPGAAPFCRVMINFDLAHVLPSDKQLASERINDLVNFCGTLAHLLNAVYGFGTSSYAVDDEFWANRSIIYQHIASGDPPQLLWKMQYFSKNRVNARMLSALNVLGATIQQYPQGILVVFEESIANTGRGWIDEFSAKWQDLISESRTQILAG